MDSASKLNERDVCSQFIARMLVAALATGQRADALRKPLKSILGKEQLR